MSTIRRRLTLRLLIVWAFLLLIGGVFAYVTTRTALVRQFDNTMSAKAAAVATAIEIDHGKVTVDYSDGFMHEFDANGSAFFEILLESGQIVRSHSFPGEVIGKSPLLAPWIGPHFAEIQQQNKIPDSIPDTQPAKNTRKLMTITDWYNAILPNGIPARVLSFPVVLRSEKDPEPTKVIPLDVDVILAMDRRELDKSLLSLAIILTGSGLLVLMLTAVVVPRLLKHELSPLDRLANQAQRISAESLAERFTTEGLPGELAPISARLNDLLQRLQTSFNRERQFSDDLAHEFRTPIAELRSLAELSLKWPDARNADTDRNTLAIALQMEAMINRILAMARSSKGQLPIATESIDLNAMISSVLQSLQSRAATRQLTLQVEVAPALKIESDSTLLRSIVTNLLDNAVEYSAPGGAVKIHGEINNGVFTLQITNPVQNLVADDVPHLFERFWRKDAARSGGEHSGLGLPLARTFATSLGLTLTSALDGNAHLIMKLSGPVHPKSNL